MKTPSGHIKTKIVSGYLLLFLLTVTAIVVIYKQIANIGKDDKPVSEANQKLFIIGNTITGLYEAEALGYSFVQTGNKQLFLSYANIMGQVETGIDSLKNMTTEEGQQKRIDTIINLLEQKTQNLEELIRIRQGINPEEFYSKALNSIEATRDTIQEYLNIHKKTITTQDSSFIVPPKKKKGFLGIFKSNKKDSSLQVTVSRQVIVDSVNSQASTSQTDSVISILKNVWTGIQQKNSALSRQISRQEYNIVLKSAAITEQLKRILSEFENEEFRNSIAKTQQKQQALDNSANLIASISVLAIILIAVFCFMILRDISKSQQYRKELEEAKKYADRLLETREKMMLTVTHDIKSPLGSINGYIELLDSSTLDQRQAYYLKNMKSSAGHILNLVTKLLDFSRLENNKVTPEEVNYNPLLLLQEIGDSFFPQAESKGLELHINIDKELNREFKGDALRIRQIVLNILSNAVKYTRQGYIELNAGFTPDKKGMTVYVKDTGPGMSAEEQRIIFNEFTRLSSDANKDIEGTGLGLTITHKLVKLLEGDITLESHPGKGSCFKVALPLKEALTKTDEKPVENISVLLIDDDPLQLEMTVSLLQNKGAKADPTTSPAEFMQKLQDNPYDVILSDIQMPEMDGFELVKKVRNSDLPGAKDIPVIALSARSDMEEKTYQEAGFTAYLNKPFTGAQLFEVISRITGKQKIFTQSVQEQETGQTEGYTLKNIMEFTDNDPQATTEVIRSFIRETEQNLKLLETGNEAEQIKKTAHKMLPMFRQLEAKKAVIQLEKLERTEQSQETVKKAIEACQELLKYLSEASDHANP